jgi:SAM-dependent methyltransferase
MSAVPARERWNERYDHDGFEPFPPTPAPWLVEHESLLRGVADGHETRAIDVACGDGRNARYLAELGFAVEAVDVSDIAVAALRAAAAERGLRVDARALDLEHEAPQRDAFDVVVCTNYLQRDLFGELRAALRPGGLLVYETFSRAHVEELGKSFNPAFVLDHNELLAAFAGLRVLHYREGVVDREGSPRGVASIVAQRVESSPH